MATNNPDPDPNQGSVRFYFYQILHQFSSTIKRSRGALLDVLGKHRNSKNGGFDNKRTKSSMHVLTTLAGYWGH